MIDRLARRVARHVAGRPQRSLVLLGINLLAAVLAVGMLGVAHLAAILAPVP